MNEQTIATLNAINRHFYTQVGTSFSETRERPWQGWETLLPHLKALKRSNEVFSTLDVGCGNARFAEFLGSHLSSRVDYLGVDFSPVLLHLAKARLDRIHSQLERGRVLGLDLLALARGERPEGANAVLDPRFTLISCFGLFHHIAGSQHRQALLRFLADRLEPGGVIALSVWRFLEFDRMQKKVVPWQEYNERAPAAVDLSQLEEGDCLLRWGGETTAHRYCHFSSEAEIDRLLQDLGLSASESFEADGVEGALNRYYLLTKG